MLVQDLDGEGKSSFFFFFPLLRLQPGQLLIWLQPSAWALQKEKKTTCFMGSTDSVPWTLSPNGSLRHGLAGWQVSPFGKQSKLAQWTSCWRTVIAFLWLQVGQKRCWKEQGEEAGGFAAQLPCAGSTPQQGLFGMAGLRGGSGWCTGAQEHRCQRVTSFYPAHLLQHLLPPAERDARPPGEWPPLDSS